MTKFYLIGHNIIKSKLILFWCENIIKPKPILFTYIWLDKKNCSNFVKFTNTSCIRKQTEDMHKKQTSTRNLIL